LAAASSEPILVSLPGLAMTIRFVSLGLADTAGRTGPPLCIDSSPFRLYICSNQEVLEQVTRTIPTVFILIALCCSLAWADGVTTPDPKGDSVGTRADAAKSADITKVIGDCVTHEVAVAVFYAVDPATFLKNNSSCAHIVKVNVKAVFEGEALSGFAEVTFANASVPTSRCEPEGQLMVFDAYIVEGGYQIRIDLGGTPKSVRISVSAAIASRDAKQQDETDEFDVPVREKGAIFLVPPPPPPEEDTEPVERKLNRDQYRPPKGGYGWTDDPDGALAKVEEAKQALAIGDAATVWDASEAAILAAPDYATKFAARDLLFKAGPIDADELSDEEKARVQGCIGGERMRYYSELEPASEQGKIARVKLYYKTAEEYGMGTGNLADYEKMERDYLLSIGTKEAPDLEEMFRRGGFKALRKEADRAIAAGEFERTYLVLYHFRMQMMTNPEKPTTMEAMDDEMQQIGRKILDAVPADEVKMLNDAVNHPAWGRIATHVTRHFIFIVPTEVATRITNDSAMRLDIAFTFEADFFNVSQAKYNERITVFLKELWGFGGGTGGGSTINIGYKWAAKTANPAVVDSGLYTHELGHCMTGGYWYLFPGWVEGIACIAATMSEDCLGRHANADGSLARAIANGKKFFIDRNIPYWRSQNYDPSFAVMCGPLYKLPLVAGAFDWAKMRAAMRDFCAYPIRPSSLFEYAWAWAKSLEPYFGTDIYKYYANCRFPLDPKTPMLVQDDMDFYFAEFAIARRKSLRALEMLLDRIEEENPRSYFRQKVLYEIMFRAHAEGEAALEKEARTRLGLVQEALVLGPYNDGNGILSVQEPELKIERAREYHNYAHTTRWEQEECDETGFFSRRTTYGGYWSGYVLAYVNVPKETEAVVWVRSVVGYSVWINNRLVEKEPMYDHRAWNSGTDFSCHPIKLEAGWNKLLGRFNFYNGTGSMRMRITDPNGSPIPGLTFSADDHEAECPKPMVPFAGRPIFTDDFGQGFPGTKWQVGSGKFTAKSGRLYSDNGGAFKFRWVVVPVEKKKPDPAMAWIKNPAVDKLTDYRLELDTISLDGSPPILYITLDGSGDGDICSGVSLHLESKDSVYTWKLCYYDTVYYSGIIKDVAGEKHQLKLDKADGCYTFHIDDKPVFQNLCLHTPNHGLIGIAYTKDELALDAVSVTPLTLRKEK